MPAKNGAGNRLVSLGSSPAREYSLDKPTIAIGSHPKNDVVADDTTVSRRHATITRKADGFELADLGSTNGTFVNGRRLTEPVVLKPGDEIKFGSVRFGFNPNRRRAACGSGCDHDPGAGRWVRLRSPQPCDAAGSVGSVRGKFVARSEPRARGDEYSVTCGYQYSVGRGKRERGINCRLDGSGAAAGDFLVCRP